MIWIRIEMPQFICAVMAEGDRIVQAPAVVRWASNRPLKWFLQWVEQHAGKWEKLTA
jgi:hypothetical protein